VDRFPPQAVQRHAEAVTEARQAGSAVGLHEDMACFNVTAHSIASHQSVEGTNFLIALQL